jgi:hypothetical protein
VRTIVDPQINMTWGTGLITPAASDYVSVRWTGKAKPQFTETYTFFVSSDDGARLWVDNSLLIDRIDSSANDTAGTIALRANVFYAIKLEYKEVTGAAFVSLSWASPSTAKEIIPPSLLYFEAHVPGSPFALFVAPSKGGVIVVLNPPPLAQPSRVRRRRQFRGGG